MNGKKSNSKLLETFEARRHVTAYANQTQRQDKLGTGKKPKRKDLTRPLSHITKRFVKCDKRCQLLSKQVNRKVFTVL